MHKFHFLSSNGLFDGIIISMLLLCSNGAYLMDSLNSFWSSISDANYWCKSFLSNFAYHANTFLDSSNWWILMVLMNVMSILLYLDGFNSAYYCLFTMIQCIVIFNSILYQWIDLIRNLDRTFDWIA